MFEIGTIKGEKNLKGKIVDNKILRVALFKGMQIGIACICGAGQQDFGIGFFLYESF